MKLNGVVVERVELFDVESVYVDLGYYKMRVDSCDCKDGTLPNIGDIVEIEIRGRYWIQAKIIRRLKVNWKKEGF
jgi:DNA modification methylase